MTARTAGLALALAAAPVLAAAPSLAQAKKPEARLEDLTAEEKAEREGRKECKLAICAALHNRKPGGGDISCSVLKTWRKEQIVKVVEKAKVSWPWGRIRCTSDIKLRRADLIRVLAEPKLEATLDKHQVNCEVEREHEAPATIRVDLSPKVTFEGGKAVKAQLNWGQIEAPALVKGAMWTATATDNTFNVLQSTLVDDINDFIGPKCEEVRDDWKGR
jgi:hypothetical protein